METEKYIENLHKIVNSIKEENENDKLKIYVNEYDQIILEIEINNIETIYSINNIMFDINLLQGRYLYDFESMFEIIYKGKNPVIVCSYEKF